MNKAMIIGKVKRKSRLYPSTGGYVFVTLEVVTDELYITAEGEEYLRLEDHRVVVTQKQAELCSYCLELGDRVYVEGPLRARKWRDMHGLDRYTTEIFALRVIPMDDNVLDKMEKIRSNPVFFPTKDEYIEQGQREKAEKLRRIAEAKKTIAECREKRRMLEERRAGFVKN